MAQEKVLKSKSVSYGYVELVESFSFLGSKSYLVKVDGQIKWSSSSLDSAAEKFASM